MQGEGSIVAGYRGGEYAQRGDYHRQADSTWNWENWIVARKD